MTLPRIAAHKTITSNEPTCSTREEGLTLTAVAIAPAEALETSAQQFAPDELEFDVYSKPACVQCKATYRQFKKDGVEFNEKDATDEANNEFVKGLGYMQAPVIVARSLRTGEIIRHWSGFNPNEHVWAKGIVHPPVTEGAELLAA